MNRCIETGVQNFPTEKEKLKKKTLSRRSVVQELEQVALRSHWFTRPHVFGKSMYAPLKSYEGESEGILKEQLQSTRERLGLSEDQPLIIGDLGCAYGIAVAQLNQMEGVEAFGIDQYRYPTLGNLTKLLYNCLTTDQIINRFLEPNINVRERLQYGLLVALKEHGISPEMLRRERHIVAKIQKMKRIHDDVFDFLISSFTLIHLDEKTLTHAIREINRVLVPKGGVLLYIGKENASSAGKYFERLRNVKVLYSGDGSLIHFEYDKIFS